MEGWAIGELFTVALRETCGNDWLFEAE